MLKPTQDKEAIMQISSILDIVFNNWDETQCDDCHARDEDGTCSLNGELPEARGCQQMDDCFESTTNKILAKLEELGYYKGLPSSIEEALNSGDGVYRP